MAAIRVVLIGMSPMVRDIVKQSVLSQVEAEIVGELLTDEPTKRLRVLKPEVVIMSLSRNESDDAASRLLKILPTAKVVALSHDNRRASIYTMRAHRLVLSEFSPQQIAEWISRAH